MTFQVATERERESRVKLMTTMDITEGGADLSAASQSRQVGKRLVAACILRRPFYLYIYTQLKYNEARDRKKKKKKGDNG